MSVDWDQLYREGNVFWDKGEPSPPLRQYLSRTRPTGRALVPGCGRGHEVSLCAEFGLDAVGLDISPTGLGEARSLYPLLADRFVLGSVFDPPERLRGSFDCVIEHTCMSAIHPSLRLDYRKGIDLALSPGGRLIGVWFINPDLAPGEEGPPYRLEVSDLYALFREGYQVVDDYVPTVGFDSRIGRERIVVFQKLT